MLNTKRDFKDDSNLNALTSVNERARKSLIDGLNFFNVSIRESE